MFRYTAAVIGLGRIADGIDEEFVGCGLALPLSHMGSYAQVDDVEVVAAADLEPQQRERFGQRWGLLPEQLYESYEQMLVEHSPDIVSVCTTSGPRAEIIRDIARLVAEGRTQVRCVWAEKPLAIRLSDADDLVRECADAGVLLVTNTQRPLDPQVEVARRLLDSGEIGPVRQIIGAAMGDLSHNGVHMLAAMCFLAGGTEPSGQRIEWVVGDALDDVAAAGDDDFRAHAYLTFTGGARGLLRMVPAGSTSSLEVIGDEGSLMIRDFDGSLLVELWRDRPAFDGGRPVPHCAVLQRPAQTWSGSLGELRNIVDCLDGNGRPTTPGELGRHLLEVVLAIRESSRAGRNRVDLPLKDRSVSIRSLDARGGGTRTAITIGHKPLAYGVLADYDRDHQKRASGGPSHY